MTESKGYVLDKLPPDLLKYLSLFSIPSYRVEISSFHWSPLSFSNSLHITVGDLTTTVSCSYEYVNSDQQRQDINDNITYFLFRVKSKNASYVELKNRFYVRILVWHAEDESITLLESSKCVVRGKSVTKILEWLQDILRNIPEGHWLSF